MGSKTAFAKSEGLGNDFIILNNYDGRIEMSPEVVVLLCDRRFGIGADGLMLVDRSHEADFRMVFFNSDGSIAEMCGNGIRCFAKYLHEHELMSSKTMTIETGAGVKTVDLVFDEGRVFGAKVDMGKPEFEASLIPIGGELGNRNEITLEIDGAPITGTCVSMGNPHFVIFVDDLKTAPVALQGSAIEVHTAFPQKTNVEFARVVSSTEIQLRVWERGVGETLACGTGACATAVASSVNGLTGVNTSVYLPGGRLDIEWRGGDQVFMTGPAREVFTGLIDLSTFRATATTMTEIPL
ncbi:MAG: diaminopimelate epimerase [Chloroflexi bacterium]|nr:diaminopimelate epimerase [Chloroflexota bacterium]